MRFAKYEGDVKAFFKSLCDSGLEYHLDEDPYGVKFGEETFTEEEAEYLKVTIPVIKQKHGDDMWNVFLQESKLIQEMT